MRILFISAVDIRTHRGGCGTVTRALIEVLRQPPLKAQLEMVAPEVTGPSWHRVRQLSSLLISLVTRMPAKAAFTYSPQLLNAVQRLVRRGDFDLVVLNLSDLVWLLPHLPPGWPCVLIAHNIEHQLFRSQIESLPPAGRLLRRFLLRDWRRLRAMEVSGWRRIRNVVFLSQSDADFARRECPDLNSLVVPPLFVEPPGLRALSAPPSTGLEMGFMANFNWWPNREGLRWFLENVLPHLGIHDRLHLFGEGSFGAAPNHPRVVPHGFLPSMEDIWATCHFMICPIFSGGGVRVKLAEAVHHRMPVLATSFAARGLPLPPDPAIVLRDRPEDWILFLRSGDARTLCTRLISPALGNLFRPATYADQVARYFSALLASSATRRAPASAA